MQESNITPSQLNPPIVMTKSEMIVTPEEYIVNIQYGYKPLRVIINGVTYTPEINKEFKKEPKPQKPLYGQPFTIGNNTSAAFSWDDYDNMFINPNEDFLILQTIDKNGNTTSYPDGIRDTTDTIKVVKHIATQNIIHISSILYLTKLNKTLIVSAFNIENANLIIHGEGEDKPQVTFNTPMIVGPKADNFNYRITNTKYENAFKILEVIRTTDNATFKINDQFQFKFDTYTISDFSLSTVGKIVVGAGKSVFALSEIQPMIGTTQDNKPIFKKNNLFVVFKDSTGNYRYNYKTVLTIHADELYFKNEINAREFIIKNKPTISRATKATMDKFLNQYKPTISRATIDEILNKYLEQIGPTNWKDIQKELNSL